MGRLLKAMWRRVSSHFFECAMSSELVHGAAKRSQYHLIHPRHALIEALPRDFKDFIDVYNAFEPAESLTLGTFFWSVAKAARMGVDILLSFERSSLHHKMSKGLFGDSGDKETQTVRVRT